METESNWFKPRLVAVVESLALFGLAVLLFHGLRQIPAVGGWVGQVLKIPAVAYLGILLLSPLMLVLSRRDFRQYGLVLRPVRNHLSVFAAAFLPVFLLSAALTWITWWRWPGAILVSGVAFGMLALTARLLRGKPDWDGAALLPLALAAPLASANLAGVLVRLGTAYLLVAPAEEALFRGCIQSRLNLAFGRPFCTWGIRWGWGLLVASGLFGLWHLALNPSAGPQALWTVFAGLIFGIVREKSGSVTAPALLHGVLNYGPQALLYDLFFSIG